MKHKILLVITLTMVLITLGVVGCASDFGFPDSTQLPELPDSGG